MEDASLRPATRPNLYVPRRSSRIALHAPAAILNMPRRHHQATLGNAAHHGSVLRVPPGECSYGTGKVKLRPRQIFRVFPGVGEQPQGKRSKQQQHKCRFEDGFEIHGPMTRRGRSSCSKKTEPGRGTNVKHDALVCCPVDRKIEQEMRSRPFTELVLKGAPP